MLPPEAPGKIFAPCFFQFLVAVSIPALVATQLHFLPLSSHGLCLWVCPLCVSWEHLSLDLGPAQINPGLSHFKILNLITSAKTLFLNKVTFTGSGGSGYGHAFCGGPAFTHYKMTLGPSFCGWWTGTRLHTPVIFFFFFLTFKFL